MSAGLFIFLGLVFFILLVWDRVDTNGKQGR